MQFLRVEGEMTEQDVKEGRIVDTDLAFLVAVETGGGTISKTGRLRRLSTRLWHYQFDNSAIGSGRYCCDSNTRLRREQCLGSLL